ncbi:hypothetical protein BC828DRAFT_307161 [Blastocladiella britannica]|nr:hypothetical protein BC828DRAFT_307161 [Blastocladiella britannica]
MSAAASNFLVVLHLALAPIPLCAALALVWLGRATRTAEILHRHPSHRSHPATAVPRAWLLPLTYTSLVLCAVQIALAGARWLTVLDETADAAGGSSTAPADQTIPTTLLNALMLSVGLVSQTFCDALVAFQLSELARRLPAVVAVDTTQSSASVAVVSGGTFPFLRLAMWASAGTAVVVRVFAQAALIFLIAGSTTRDLPAVQIATLCVKVGSAVAIAIFHTAMVAHRLYIQHARFPNAALQGPLAIPLVLSTTCAILASAHTVTATLAVWTLFLLSYVLGCAYLTLSTAWPGTLAVVAVDATDGLPRSSGSTVTMHGQHSAPNGAMRKRIQHTEYGRVSDSAAELAPVSWDRAPLLPDAIDLDNVHSPVPEIQTVAPSRQQVAAAAAASVAVDPHALAHSEWPIRSSGLSNTSSHLTGTGAPPGPALATLVKHVATDTSSSSPPPTDAHSLPYRTLYAADITAAMRAVTSSASPPASLVDPLPVSSSTSLPLTAATPTVAPIAPSPAASPLLKQPQKSAGAAPPRPAPLPDLRLDLSSFRFRGPNEVTDRFVSFVEERFNVVARFYPAELLRAAIRRGPGPAGPPDAAQAQPTRTSSLDAELTPPSAAATADNGPADGRTGSTIDDVIAMANSPWFSAAAQCHRTMRESATVLPPSLLDVSMLAPKRAPTTAAAASNIVVMALPVHFNAKKLGVLVLWPWRSARLLLSSGETGLVRAPLPQDHERIFAMQMVSFFAAYLFSAVYVNFNSLS